MFSTRSEVMNIDRFEKDDAYIDKDGARWDCAEDFIHGSLLGFCTCGDPWGSLTFVRDVLRHIQRRYDLTYEQWLEAGKKIGSRESLYFAWYVLDEKGFTDHGGSVPGWLTESGTELLEDLETLLSEEENVDTGYGATAVIQKPGAVHPIEVEFIFDEEERSDGA